MTNEMHTRKVWKMPPTEFMSSHSVCLACISLWDYKQDKKETEVIGLLLSQTYSKLFTISILNLFLVPDIIMSRNQLLQWWVFQRGLQDFLALKRRFLVYRRPVQEAVPQRVQMCYIFCPLIANPANGKAVVRSIGLGWRGPRVWEEGIHRSCWW